MFKVEIQQHVGAFWPICACTNRTFFLFIHLKLEALPNASKVRKCRWNFIFEQRKAIFSSTYPVVDLNRWCACSCVRDFGACSNQVLDQFEQFCIEVAGHAVSIASSCGSAWA